MKKVTREAIKIVAEEKGITEIAMVTELQGACAAIDDETTLDTLIDIKNGIMEEMGL